MPWVTLKNGRKVFIFRRGNVNEFEKSSNEKPEERRTKWQIYEEKRERKAQELYGKKFDTLSPKRQSTVEVYVAGSNYRERTGNRGSLAADPKRLDRLSNQYYQKDFHRLNSHQKDTVLIHELDTRR